MVWAQGKLTRALLLVFWSKQLAPSPQLAAAFVLLQALKFLAKVEL